MTRKGKKNEIDENSIECMKFPCIEHINICMYDKMVPGIL